MQEEREKLEDKQRELRKNQEKKEIKEREELQKEYEENYKNFLFGKNLSKEEDGFHSENDNMLKNRQRNGNDGY